MNSKDQEFIERLFHFFEGFLKILPPLEKGKNPKTPLDLFKNFTGAMNKMIDNIIIRFENLPPYMEKIFEINRDAQRAFIDGRYSDYITLRYKGAEIFYKSLYKELFQVKDDEIKDKKLHEMILEVEKQLNMNSGILEELNEWRKIRNNIIHDHLKVSKSKALEAEKFFNKLYRLFNKYLKI
ncbi:MAG: hypothetical protein ACTSVV_07805 [Promethearchaeota archaeon]